MKIQTATTLAVFLAIVPSVHAQRRGPQAEQAPQPMAQRTPQRPNLPTSPILPMTNPVLPMTNPVQPIIRYGVGGTPTVVIPTTPARVQEPDRKSNDHRSGDRRRDAPVVILGGPYIDPYYYPPYYNQPYLTPAPVPGQLPGVYQPEQVPVVYAVPVSPSPGVAGGGPAALSADEPISYPEPRMIITPPEPDIVVEPPAIGTARADVLMRYGQPWGSISTQQGKETLYFRNLTVVLEGGRVTQIR